MRYTGKRRRRWGFWLAVGVWALLAVWILTAWAHEQTNAAVPWVPPEISRMP